MFFKDRNHAGQMLAGVLKRSKRDFSSWTTVGIARGGVIVAHEIARALEIPLQVICIEDTPTENGPLVVTSLGNACLFAEIDNAHSPVFIPDVFHLKKRRLHKLGTSLKARHLRLNHSRSIQTPKKAIIVDDGLVGGTTALTAIHALINTGTEEVVLAVPILPQWLKNKRLAGTRIFTWRVTKISNPSTGMFYFNFNQVTDEEVMAITAAA